MAKVDARQGNIFEGGADLTVLPCSAKGTVSSSTRQWLEIYCLPPPLETCTSLRLGDLTPLIPFGGPPKITKHVVFAASVFNDATTFDALFNIGKSLGSAAAAQGLRVIESPVLGTGAGRLPLAMAGRALAGGFKETAPPDATLQLFVYGSETAHALDAALNSNLLRRIVDAIEFKLGFGPVSVDVKQAFRSSRRR